MLFLNLAPLALAACCSLVHSTPILGRPSYAVKDSHHVPRKWSRVSEAPSDHVVKLEIALKQSQFDELERQLYEGKMPLR